MEVKNTQRVAENKKGVFISPNPIRVREMLDRNGNVINPITKEIIRTAEENK